MARKDKTKNSPDAPPPFPEGWRFVRLDTKLARKYYEIGGLSRKKVKA
jgi:hypothetical protein